MATFDSSGPPPPSNRARSRPDSAYRSPSEYSYDSRRGSHYDHDRATQRTAYMAEEKSKRDSLTKWAIGAAVIYGLLRMWSGEKEKEQERQRKRETRRDFEKRKAARRREEERREREMEGEEDDHGGRADEAEEVRRIAYAPARARSQPRRTRSRAPDLDQEDEPRSRSRGPPNIDGPTSPPSMTRASNIDGHGYEEYRSRSMRRQDGR